MATVTPALAARRKAVFAACRQLNMDEDARRDMLRQVVGVDSTTRLTMDTAQAVLDHLRKVGAVRPGKSRNVGQHPGAPTKARPGADAMVGKIEAQLADMGLAWEYARQILIRVSGGWQQPGKLGIEAFEFAPAAELKKVIAALAYEQEKRQLLDAVDEVLTATGRTRADVAELVPHLPAHVLAGWERKPAVLRLVLAAMRQEA